MHRRFVDGYDGEHVNYEEIDTDARLDDKKQIEQDSEDKYFDEERASEEVLPSKDSVYTGELDY